MIHPGQAPETLSRLLAGELPRAERWRVERHLVRCGSCRTQWRRLRFLDQALSEAKLERTPLALVDSVYEECAAEIGTTSPAPWSLPTAHSWTALPMAAAIAAVVVLTLGPDLRRGETSKDVATVSPAETLAPPAAPAELETVGMASTGATAPMEASTAPADGVTLVAAPSEGDGAAFVGDELVADTGALVDETWHVFGDPRVDRARIVLLIANSPGVRIVEENTDEIVLTISPNQLTEFRDRLTETVDVRFEDAVIDVTSEPQVRVEFVTP